jgi:purine-nucleoside phosphorylase
MDPFARAEASAGELARRTGQPAHDVAVILGSGWTPAADALAPAASGVEVPLSELGGFAPTTVAGHSPVVRSVCVGGLRVLIFLGRVHLYEGHPVATVVHGVRTAIAAGCRVLVVTNAAGGIREDLQAGQPVLVSDHINMTGLSPLTGDPPPAGYPSRFTDLTDLYSQRLRLLAEAADPGLAQGVYAALPGPHYETPAEIRMLRALGADLVGMSTALEAIAARHLGAEVLAVSLVTNLAAGLAASGQAPRRLDHGEVLATGEAAAARVGALLAGILPGMLPEGMT